MLTRLERKSVFGEQYEDTLPVGSLAGGDGGAGLQGVGGEGAGAEAAVGAAEGTHSLHRHTGVSACLTHTLLFAPTENNTLVRVI